MAKRIKSAIKKHRKSLIRRERNRYIRSTLRTEIKKLYSMLATSNPVDLQEALRNVTRKIDKAATKGVIHKNKASRLVARLSKKVHSVLGSQARTEASPHQQALD